MLRLALISVLMLLAACANRNITRPTLVANSAEQCRSPSGHFSNFGRSFSEDQEGIPPLLTNLIYEGELGGFDVNRISLETNSAGNLVVRAWVGSTLLNESREIEPSGRSCENGRWQFTTKWNGLLLEGVVAGLLWTGGIFLPAAQRNEYNISFTETGDLALRYNGRTAGTYFFFFPMYSRSGEAWFTYPRVAATEAP